MAAAAAAAGAAGSAAGGGPGAAAARLTVRFIGRPDLALDGLPLATTRAADVVQRIKALVPEYAGKYLRLVHLGRVLADSTALQDAGVVDGAVLHCAVADHTPPPSASGSNGPPPEHRVVPNVGFDRLREAGFTDDDIANFRQQFHGRDGHLPDEATMREREEAWMNNMGTHQQAGDDEYGDRHHLEFLTGVALGFVGGFLVVFLAAAQLFPQRCTFGIMAGVAVNLSFGFLRLSYT